MIINIFKNLFLIICMFACACRYVLKQADALGGQKVALDTLKLELRVDVSHVPCALGPKLQAL